MAVIWMEGADNQTGAADMINGVLDAIYTSTSGATGGFSLVSGYNFGGKAIALTATGLNGFAAYAKNTPNTVTGFTANNVYLTVPGAGQDYNHWWAFYDQQSTILTPPQVLVAIDAGTGKISVYRGNAPGTLPSGAGTGTLLGQTLTAPITTNAWFSVEIGITVSAVSGSVTIKVGGAIKLALSGINTKSTSNAYFSRVVYGTTLSAGTGTTPVDINDDFYIGDSTTGSYNTFIGPGSVWTRFATSNGNVAFTPLSGSNYQMIDETAMDGDTSYNASNTLGAQDTFSSTGTISSTFTPLFIKIQQASRADASGGRSTQNVLNSSGAGVLGTSSSRGTIYAYSDDYFLLDPATGIGWTLAGIEATKFGYQISG